MDGMGWDAYLGAFPAQLLHVSTVRPPMQEMCCGSRFRREFVGLAIVLFWVVDVLVQVRECQRNIVCAGWKVLICRD
jgi:hypothetical protein